MATRSVGSPVGERAHVSLPGRRYPSIFAGHVCAEAIATKARQHENLKYFAFLSFRVRYNLRVFRLLKALSFPRVCTI